MVGKPERTGKSTGEWDDKGRSVWERARARKCVIRAALPRAGSERKAEEVAECNGMETKSEGEGWPEGKEQRREQGRKGEEW